MPAGAEEEGCEYGVLSLSASEGSDRPPADIVCIIDVSGSMGEEATVEAEAGRESDGLSILDLVKHACRTVSTVLADHDRMALVAYSDTASVLLPLTSMDSAGKTAAEAATEALVPLGPTNLWDGLKTGLDMLAADGRPGRSPFCFVLTDGRPNRSPPRGEVKMLERYAAKAPAGRLPAVVQTFGFGYDLDTALLGALASVGSGTFAFIPEAGFVGTVFVHAVANALTMAAHHAVLTLTPSDPAARIEVLGTQSRPGGAASVAIGTLQAGQTRDIGFLLTGPPGSAVSATVTLHNSGTGAEQQLALPELARGEGTQSATTWCRAKLVEHLDARRAELHRLAKRGRLDAAACTTAMDACEALAVRLRATGAADLDGVLADLEGQVVEAVSRPQWFERWGQHYLPSLADAHRVQQCNNFKDPGVQDYGGERFRAIQERADEVFLALPPPTPTAAATREATRVASPAARPTRRRAAAPIDMRRYHTAAGGCIDGACRTLLQDGTLVRLDRLAPGQRVALPGGGSAAVRCIVQTQLPPGATTDLVTLGSLRITPHHPVHREGRWRFPNDLGTCVAVAVPAVYSVLLERGAALLVEGVPVTALGHGIAHDPVAAHPFFGSRAAVEHSLEQLTGWRTGVVTLQCGEDVARDPTTGLVVGFRQESKRQRARPRT